MENGGVYNTTTEPQAKPARRPFGCTLRHLWGWHLTRLEHVICLQILSLLAVICEEIVEDCINCGGLYFFEFTSCSAFLLSLLILCVYCTDAYETFGEDKVRRV
ncbi:CKLF6 protein, partial [Arenaria interpres]|nr:CKLF6 protein [Arenaria interpres]